MTTVRVLSIDGGGIRGIIPAILLDVLERTAGRAVHEMFDLVSGTSTGGILACGLVAPQSRTAREILSLYLARGSEVFAANRLRAVGSLLTSAKYDHKPLESLLAEILGDGMLSQTRTKLLVPAYDLQNRAAKFFKSWRANGQESAFGEWPEDADFLLRDVARATSAAPTYFEPAFVRNRAGKSFALVDGAVFANNPAMCALASARRLYPDASRIVLVSIGAGQSSTPIPYAKARTWGALSWAKPALDIMMDGVADTVDYQVRECFEREVRYFRLQTGIGSPTSASEALDDATPANVRRLIVQGNELAKSSAAEIAGILSLVI